MKIIRDDPLKIKRRNIEIAVKEDIKEANAQVGKCYLFGVAFKGEVTEVTELQCSEIAKRRHLISYEWVPGE